MRFSMRQLKNRFSTGQFFELEPHKLDLIYSKTRIHPQTGSPEWLADFYDKIVYFNGAGGAGGEAAGTRNFHAKSYLYDERHDSKMPLGKRGFG